MNRLNICIDIDGTVTHSDDWLSLINDRFGTSFASEDQKTYDYHTLIGISREDYEAFYHENKKDMFAKSSFRPKSKEVIFELYRNHHVHFVTARDKEVEEVTLKWLQQNSVEYDSITHLGSHHKVERAIEVECDLFIEDRYENAWELSQAGFDVLLMNCPYNQGPVHYRTTRVCHWMDVLEYVLDREALDSPVYVSALSAL